MRVWIFVSLFIFVHSVHVSKPLQDISLFANETTLIDISHVFVGASLDFEVRGPQNLVATVPLFTITEVYSQRAEGRKPGPAFSYQNSYYFTLYSSRLIELWILQGSNAEKVWTFESAQDIERVETLQQGKQQFLVYWTTLNCSLYILRFEAVHHEAERLLNITCEADSIIYASQTALRITVATPQQNYTKVCIFDILYDSEPIVVEKFSFLFPIKVIDVVCEETCFTLTSHGIHYKSVLLKPVHSHFFGNPIRILMTPYKMYPFVQTDQGVLMLSSNHRMEFVVGFKHLMLFDSITSQKVFASVRDRELILGLFTEMDKSLGYVFPTGVRYNTEGETGFSSLSIDGIVPTSFIIIGISNCIYGYRVQHSPGPYLRISHSLQSYTFDLCAFDYFNRSDFACTKVSVTPHSHTDIDHLNFTCILSRPDQICKASLQFMAPNLGLSVDFQSNQLKCELQTRFKAISATYSPVKPSCAGWVLGKLAVVTLEANTARILLLQTGTVLTTVKTDKIYFNNCAFTEKVLVLYGVTTDGSGKLFTHYMGELQEYDLSQSDMRSRLIKIDDAIIAIATDRVLVFLEFEFHLKVASIYTEGTVLSLSRFNNFYFLLFPGRLDIYYLNSGKSQLFQSIAVSTDIHEIAYTDNHLVTFSYSNIVSVFYFAGDGGITLLSRLEFPCNSPEFAHMRDNTLIVCTDKVQSLSVQISQGNLLQWQHVFENQHALHLLATSAEKVSIVECNEEKCQVTTFLGTETVENSIIFQFISTKSAFIGGNLTVAGTMQVKSYSQLTASVPITATFINEGAFVLATWNSTNWNVDCRSEACVPVWGLFSGNNQTLEILSDLDNIRLVQSCEFQYSIPINCGEIINEFVLELNLMICIGRDQMLLKQAVCSEGSCSVKILARLSISEFGLVRLYRFRVLFTTKTLLFFEAEGITPEALSEEDISRKVMVIETAENNVRILHHQPVTILEFHSYVVEQSHNRFHLILYGAMLQHFSITITPLSISMTESLEVFLINIISVSSDGEYVWVLDSADRLHLFELTETMEPRGSVGLNRALFPGADNLYLYRGLLITTGGFAVSVYSLPQQVLIRTMHVPFSMDAPRGVKAILVVPGSSDIFGIIDHSSEELFILSLSAPSNSTVQCAYRGKYFTAAGNLMAFYHRASFSVFRIATPTLLISGKHFAERHVILAGSGADRQTAETEIVIRRNCREERDFLSEIYAVLGGVLAWLGYECCRNCAGRGRKRETEVELVALQLSASS